MRALMVMLVAMFMVAGCADKEGNKEQPKDKKEQVKKAEGNAKETAPESTPGANPAPSGDKEAAGEKIEEARPAEDTAAVDPHAAAEDNLLVAAYEVPALDNKLARKLTLALADRDGVVSAKVDKANGLFKVTYSSGCPHGMLAALQAVVPEASLQGVTARDGEAPAKSGCGGCPKKESCAGAH